MSDCPHHDGVRDDAAAGCPLHQKASALLDMLELMDPTEARTGAVLVIIDGKDIGHRTLASNLEMHLALHVLEREVARLREEMGRG